MEGRVFKACPMCNVSWATRKSFLDDSGLRLVGYQVNFEDLQAGFFLFNHDVAGCGTTIAVEAGQFLDMHSGPMFQERLDGKECCPRYCHRAQSLEPCPVQCECRYVRDVLQVVKDWPKTGREEKV
jgi:hypothetical protein